MSDPDPVHSEEAQRKKHEDHLPTTHTDEDPIHRIAALEEKVRALEAHTNLTGDPK